MSGWTMVIILCLNAVPHDQCNEETAVSVTRPIDRYALPMGCAIASLQALPAIEDADDTTYPIIKCEGSR